LFGIAADHRLQGFCIWVGHLGPAFLSTLNGEMLSAVQSRMREHNYVLSA
jgi:hypothetical protein